MAHTVQYPYGLAAGYDQPIGSITYFENIQDANGVYLYPPSSFGNYLPGAPATRFDGLEYERGRGSTDLLWTGQNGNGYLTYSGAEVIRNDFFNGNWSGSLTVNVPTDTNGSFGLYNAVGTIKKMPDSGANFKAFNKYGIKLTRMRRITP